MLASQRSQVLVHDATPLELVMEEVAHHPLRLRHHCKEVSLGHLLVCTWRKAGKEARKQGRQAGEQAGEQTGGREWLWVGLWLGSVVVPPLVLQDVLLLQAERQLLQSLLATEAHRVHQSHTVPLLLHLGPLLRLPLHLCQTLCVQLLQLWVVKQVVHVNMGI